MYHVPYAITVPPPRPGALTRARLNLPAGAFVFLFAFDFHSYFARKNPVAVVEAFRRAFGRRRDVLLVLKPMRTDAAPSQWGELLIAAQGQPNSMAPFLRSMHLVTSMNMMN